MTVTDLTWASGTRHVRAGVLDVAYLECGPADGPPAVLLHGFPYDVRSYAEVAPRLADAGMRVIVPWMRGYGPTRFLESGTPRSGEQAAFGADLLALLDALAIPRAVLGGYDWGGRGACVVAALRPERCVGLVTGNGYNLQNIARSAEPKAPELERLNWYQYYFNLERGRAGLAQNRRELCRLLWELWSPSWRFADATYEATAASFDNPDFVEVVIHSYRHRYRNAPGDPRYAAIEAQLAAQPSIGVPTIILDGEDDGVSPAPATDEPPAGPPRFTGPVRQHRLPGIGHAIPQEAPVAFADAILALRESSPS